MNILDDGTVICMSCNTRLKKSAFRITADDIGICERCYSRLRPVSPDSPFEGTEKTLYHLSAFYYNNALRYLIHKYKFNRHYKFSELFSDMLYDYIKDIPVIKDFDFLTSVPLSKQRYNERGYNQSELIAQILSEKLSVPYINCIYRYKNTLAQSTLRQKFRLENLKNAFIADREKTDGKRILLLDDIFTTGSTINSCASELIDKNASYVVGLSLGITKR